MEDKIEVKSCRECPFCTEQDEQKICNLIPEYSKWIDDEGFDEMYYAYAHPKSCPLLQVQEITVKYTGV